MKQFHSKPKINSTEDFEAHVNLWLQKTDQEGLHDLKKELHAVRQSFEMLKWEVWKDKQAKFDSFNIGIGVTFPEHAMVQPYLFEQTLKEQSTTRGQQAIK